MRSLPITARRGATAAVLLLAAACAEAPSNPRAPATTEPVVQALDGGGGRAYSLSRTRPHLVPRSRARLDLATSGDPMAFNGLERLPAEASSSGWVALPPGGDAYFRDVSIAIENELLAFNDGDKFDVTITHPNGSVEDAGAITYHENFGGQQDCFTAGLSALCGGDDSFLTTYINSQCAEAGLWTVKFLYNGAPHGSPVTFTLHPRIPEDAIPHLSQLDYPTTTYDNACKAGKGSVACTGAANEVKRTIKQKGCGLTSATMALNYFGVPGSPSSVNDFMTSHAGFVDGGNLLFPAFRKVGEQTVDTTIVFSGAVGMTAAALTQRICKFGPQILEVKSLSPGGNQHFVLAVGYSDDKQHTLIRDPASPTRTTLDAYGTWKSVRTVERPARKDTIAPGIIVTVHSPVQITATDPSGNQTGFSSHGMLAQIPGAIYDTAAALSTVGDDGNFVDDELDPPKQLDVNGAAAGFWVMKVTGMATGSYILNMAAFGPGGNSSNMRFPDIPISAGEVHSYAFNYDPSTAGTPGATFQLAGGFDGGGQSSSADQLLSYARPSERQTTLPAGTTTYSMLIFYGAGVNASTFTADLNGTDVRSLFHVVPGTNEVVSISLASGRNVLKMTTKGTVGGRSTTDQDQLVFKVP